MKTQEEHIRLVNFDYITTETGELVAKVGELSLSGEMVTVTVVVPVKAGVDGTPWSLAWWTDDNLQFPSFH